MKLYRNQYIYPPRVENKIRPLTLKKYDKDVYFAQPKLNGSNCSLYISYKDFTQRNRHKGNITNFNMNKSEIKTLFRGNKKIVLVGEYMNKGKKDFNGKIFNKKFVIFDILVYDNKYLIGETFEFRYNLLLDIYDCVEYDDYLYQITENVFLVKTFYKDFHKIYKKIIKIDMFEGLVLKKKESKLKNGNSKKNNILSQIKCRKETKNYKF